MGIDGIYLEGCPERMFDRQLSRMHDIYVQHRSELCCSVVNKFQVTRDEAEDIVQAAFARVVAIEDSSIKNPRALLYKTSYNIAIDLKRRGTVRQRHIDSVIDSEATAVEELGPERVFEGNRQLHILAKALWGMPKKRRKLFAMNRFDGFSYAEIARRVGLSETSVRKHISKGLMECQRALQQIYF